MRTRIDLPDRDADAQSQGYSTLAAGTCQWAPRIGHRFLVPNPWWSSRASFETPTCRHPPGQFVLAPAFLCPNNRPQGRARGELLAQPVFTYRAGKSTKEQLSLVHIPGGQEKW